MATLSQGCSRYVTLGHALSRFVTVLYCFLRYLNAMPPLFALLTLSSIFTSSQALSRIVTLCHGLE
jgi:hypothetical protein